MSIEALRREFMHERSLWLRRAASRWRPFSSEHSLLIEGRQVAQGCSKWTGWWCTRPMRLLSSLTDCIVVPLMTRPASPDCAPTWTIGAGWHRRWSTRTQFEVSTTFYLLSSYESLPEPLFVPQIESTENGSRHRRTRVMRAAMWALAARTSPNFGLSLGGRRHGYSGCGLAAGELGVGHSGGIAGGCSGRHQADSAL